MAEKALHQKFKNARKIGEWFAPVPELLELIGMIRKNGHTLDTIPNRPA